MLVQIIMLPGPADNPTYTPCPEILTAKEACRYLRLDLSKSPHEPLELYVKEYGLRRVKLGRAIRYRRVDLEALVERLMEANPV